LQAAEQGAAEGVKQAPLRADHDIQWQRLQLQRVRKLDQLAGMAAGGEGFLFHGFNLVAKTPRRQENQSKINTNRQDRQARQEDP